MFQGPGVAYKLHAESCGRVARMRRAGGKRLGRNLGGLLTDGGGSLADPMYTQFLVIVPHSGLNACACRPSR